MRILVTGAAGFLGRALTARLASQPGHQLHLTDVRPSPGTVLCDLLAPAEVAALLQTAAPDQIYHLAGTFTNDYSSDFAANVTASQHLLDAAHQTKRATRVLLIGSAAEYGSVDPGDNPLKESQPLAPVSIYGWTKACQTLLMRYYRRVYSLDVVMGRIFNLSGAGASTRLFVGRLEEQLALLLTGKVREITVGNLESRRDYLPVEAAAAQLERVMRFGQSGQEYHVASGVPTRMRDLLHQELRRRGLPVDCAREVLDPPAGKLDAPEIYADISKTNALPELA